MNAILTPGAVAERFRSVFLSEETGSLRVFGGGNAFTLHFDRGMMSGADASGTRLEPIPDGLAGVVRIVEMAFSTPCDSIEFEPATEAPTDSQADILKTMDFFLAGVRAMTAFEEIQEALLALDRRLVLRQNPSVPIERLTLRPIHGFLLSRFSGNFTFNEIASMVGPDDEIEAARFVFALLLLGSVGLEPPLAPGLLCTEQFLMDHRRDSAREAEETAFLREMYQAIKSPNPYHALGVAETATLEDIGKAYEERKHLMSPDRFLGKVRDRMRGEIAIIDARLGEVFLALQSGGIERGAAPASGGDAPDLEQLMLRRELTKTEVAATLDEQEKLAESYFAKAKKYFSQGDYYNCIQFCTQAIRQSEQTARYHFLLGEAQIRNPDRRWQKMAEQSYMSAVKYDPWNADYLLALGQFYKKQGFAIRARRQFQRAIEIQPGHERAREELASLGPVSGGS